MTSLHTGLEDIPKEETKWHMMSDEEQLEALKEKMRKFKMKDLSVTRSDEQTIPYQVPKHARIKAFEHRRAAAIAGLRLRMERGHLKLVRYESNQWIANMFCKGKGRENPETGLEAIRLLTDFRKINAAIAWPKWWTEECPTIDRVKQSIPKTANYFASEDISDAYESARTSDDSRHLLTAVPPVVLKASMFSDEELEKWGIETVKELREAEHLLV